MAPKKKATPVQFAEKAPQSIGRAFYNLQLDDEQLAFANAIWNPDVDIVFVDAKAGTGKTTIIIDEAQNFTIPQLQKVLTRVGKSAKVVVIGHELQCDLDDPTKSGFVTYIKHFAEHDRVAICKLTQNYRSWISQWADEV